MASASRLTTALSEGLMSLPDGAVLFWRPGADYDLGPLAQHQPIVFQTFRPLYEYWSSTAEICDAPVATPISVVVATRSKALSRDMIAQAAAASTTVIVDGQKTDGIDSLFKACRARLGDLPSVTKDHGRLFWFAGTDAFEDWRAAPPADSGTGFVTAAGVFAEGKIDAGSHTLAAALPPTLGAHVADLGAGWGYLSRSILARSDVQSLDLIEAEALALDCARRNITDPRASFHWADATTWNSPRPYTTIVMNPPFHPGRSADPALGRAFIDAAARNLAPKGSLWMVANRHLPYESSLRDQFRAVDEVTGTSAFKVFRATRPKAGREHTRGQKGVT